MFKYCAKCQVETERKARGQCKPCAKATQKAWHKANSELNKATKAAWRAANTDRVKASNAAWYKSNSEKAKACAAAWYKTNSELSKARAAARYKANPERSKASTSAWFKANPESCRIYAHNRRDAKLSSGGKLSKGLSEKLFKLQRGLCPCCNQPLGNDYHLDHIMPLKKGGANEDWNIQLLRQQCNNQKHSKDPIDFMRSRGFLI
jgi:5-methylcytosine-specific restriction endonuclease McrA